MPDELDLYIDEMTDDCYGYYCEEDDPEAIEQAEWEALDVIKEAFGS